MPKRGKTLRQNAIIRRENFSRNSLKLATKGLKACRLNITY
jgi:hypothetical protein